MLRKVGEYIKENNLIARGDRIVIGVSGGADSVCLFHVLKELSPIYQLSLYVVHVNHGIRGTEAMEDAAFVQELCREYGVPCTTVSADVPELARQEGLSEEEAGRKVRYNAFYECFKENRCNKIAIAHNKNDNAETVLFHLFRGTGIKGLTGIRPLRDEIIRPLLCVTREEIEEYLEQNHLNFRTDRTNLTDDYSRNKIRHNILTFAREEINPKAIEHIVNAAGQLMEIERYLEKSTQEAYDRTVTMTAQGSCVIPIESFIQEEPVIQKGILRKAIQSLAKQLKDVDALHINLVLDLINKEVGKNINLPYNIVAVKGYHDIILKLNISSVVNKIEEQIITAPGDYDIPQTGQILSVRCFSYKKNMIIPKNGYTKWFDYDKIKNTVILRGRNEGDYMEIDANGSRKKLKSLFIDTKIPREDRDRIPLLADGQHIMWVIGDRMSEAYKVNEETKRILEINLNGGRRNEG